MYWASYPRWANYPQCANYVSRYLWQENPAKHFKTGSALYKEKGKCQLWAFCDIDKTMIIISDPRWHGGLGKNFPYAS